MGEGTDFVTTIFGPDISSYEAGLVLSHLANASFVIAKTTEGTYYTDADYQGWRQQCAQLGKPFVWYHFLSGESAAAQVAHTAAHVGDRSLPGMLDFEPAGSFRPTIAQGLAYVDAAHAAGLRLVLLYLPRWYWEELGRPDLTGFAARGVHLVSSAYPGGTGSAPALYPGDGAGGWQSYGGMTPAIYQYTNQASDGGQSMDYNAFRGTVADLINLLNGDGDVALTPEDIQAVAAAVYNYGREDITVNGQVMHNAPLGQMVHGAWAALNDPAGAVPQMRGQVNDLHMRPAPAPLDVAALAAQLGPLLHPTTDVDALAAALAPHVGAPDPVAFAAALAPHIKVVSQ